MQATAQLIRDEAALFLGRRPTDQEMKWALPRAQKKTSLDHRKRRRRRRHKTAALVPGEAGRGGNRGRGILTVYQMHVVKESKKKTA